jgi:hypothetical protein
MGAGIFNIHVQSSVATAQSVDACSSSGIAHAPLQNWRTCNVTWSRIWNSLPVLTLALLLFS